MRTIWKYAVRVGHFTRVPIGPDAKVVLAAIDPATGGPAIWVDHVVPDVSAAPAEGAAPYEGVVYPHRLFIAEATGAELDHDMIHHGSMIDRTFVWHVLERPLKD